MWYSIESGPPAPINRNIFNSLEDISILGQFIKYLCTYLTHSSIVEIRIPDLNVRQASYTSSLYSYIQYIPLWGWGGKSERWCEIAQVPLSLLPGQSLPSPLSASTTYCLSTTWISPPQCSSLPRPPSGTMGLPYIILNISAGLRDYPELPECYPEYLSWIVYKKRRLSITNSHNNPTTGSKMTWASIDLLQ